MIALSREGLARVRVRPRRGRRAALARWQGRVSAVSHTRPNHSPVSQPCFSSPRSPTRAPITALFLYNDQSVGVLLQSRGPALFFCLFLVLDRHYFRVTACVHRRNTGRTSRIATLLCCLSVPCFQSCYFVSFILAGGDTAKMGHFVVSAGKFSSQR